MSTVSNSVNSINRANSVNSYSAELPPSPMVFLTPMNLNVFGLWEKAIGSHMDGVRTKLPHLKEFLNSRSSQENRTSSSTMPELFVMWTASLMVRLW